MVLGGGVHRRRVRNAYNREGDSGNGIAELDDDWFTYAAVADVLGMRLRLCPIEEMIRSKAFVLIRFVYPNQRDSVPSSLIHDLMRREIAQKEEPANRVCYGTLLSREQYLHDIDQLGYLDARVQPRGTMTSAETQIWTDAIKKQE